MPPFELRYIDFLFFFFSLSLSPFVQKPVVVINSCTGSATYFGVKWRGPIQRPAASSATHSSSGGVRGKQSTNAGKAWPGGTAQGCSEPFQCHTGQRMLHRAASAAQHSTQSCRIELCSPLAQPDPPSNHSSDAVSKSILPLSSLADERTDRSQLLNLGSHRAATQGSHPSAWVSSLGFCTEKGKKAQKHQVEGERPFPSTAPLSAPAHLPSSHSGAHITITLLSPPLGYNRGRGEKKKPIKK